MSFRPAGMSDDDEDVNSLEMSTSEYDAAPNEPDTKTDWQGVTQKQPSDDKFLDCDTMDELKRCIVDGHVDKLAVFSTTCDLNQPIMTGCDCGIRPIFLAAESGQDRIVEFLLDMKVSLAPDSNGLTPLMNTCTSPWKGMEKGMARCAKLLLACADPNEHQDQKITGLMLASKSGNFQVVEEFLKHPKILLDAQDTQGWTSLLYAVDAGFGDIARLLLEAGANPDIAALDGMYPVDIAMTRRNDNLVAIIQEFSSKYVLQKCSRTILFKAVFFFAGKALS